MNQLDGYAIGVVSVSRAIEFPQPLICVGAN